MTENVTATNRTKDVDTRYHYVREFVSEGFLKIIFIKSAENKSDMFTKSDNAETLDFHINSYVIDKNEIMNNG